MLFDIDTVVLVFESRENRTSYFEVLLCLRKITENQVFCDRHVQLESSRDREGIISGVLVGCPQRS